MLSSSSAIAIDFIWQLFKLQIKKNTPHAIIIFCHCHRLHLAIVQATNKEEHATCYHHLLPLP